MHLLIDADSGIYKAGMSNEEREYHIVDSNGIVVYKNKYKKEIDHWLSENPQVSDDFLVRKHRSVGPLSHSLSNMKALCLKMTAPRHDSFQMYISGKGNFRNDIYPEYKANRKEEDRPIHEAELRNYLITHWNAIPVDGEEADDRVSWESMLDPRPTCIVSIDKDLLNTPGWNYNYDKEILRDISHEEADLSFALQLLTGDSTDNIKGVAGIGAKTANKILPRYMPDWKQRVLDEYVKCYGDRGEEYMIMNGRLLWMRREPNQMWDLDT